jgi:uncharacterized protein (DUF1501 family)
LMASWREGQMAIVQGVGIPENNSSHFRAKQIWDTASLEYAGECWLNGIVHVDERTFEASCLRAARMIASDRRTQTLRITLHGFDTHENQATRHAMLLAQFARGLAFMRTALVNSGDWNRTLVMSVSEFGRSAQENASRGTEHGGAAPLFLLGGNVRGGLYGTPPRLDALDIDGGLPVDIDFRRIYATARLNAVTARFEPLPILI